MFKVYDFPTLSISKQLFHVPGAAIDGGFTTGGAAMLSPEPGGRSMLELQVSLQTREWDNPMSSWIMSKINGHIFRVRLAPTPQICRVNGASDGVPWDNNMSWSHGQNWSGDYASRYTTQALEGSNVVTVDMTAIGQVLKLGHVIGNGAVTHMIDEITYVGSVARIVVTPPLRTTIAVGDPAYFRPYFTGTIANGQEIRNTYDAENVGAIQMNRIIFNEAILP